MYYGVMLKCAYYSYTDNRTGTVSSCCSGVIPVEYTGADYQL